MKNNYHFLFPLLLLACAQKPAVREQTQSLPVISVKVADAVVFRQYPASIEGTENIEIRPQVSGILEKVFVEDGAYVRQGQPLFQIEQAPFQERLNDALASFHTSEGVLANAQLEIDKLTPLVAEKVISDIQLQTAVSVRETAAGKVGQAKAQIAIARINLGYTLIRAPFGGFIGRLLRKTGSLIGPADPSPLIELSDVRNVHVFFALGEYDLIRFKDHYAGATIEEKIKHLDPVQLILPNDSSYPFPGKVDLINGLFDRNTASITLRATFPNPKGLLRSGNTGEIKMGLHFSQQVIVPQSATGELQDQVFVFLLNKNNKVTKQIVNVSGKSGSDYLIASGLKEGDRIVYSGFDRLHEGDSIMPRRPDSTLAIVTNH